MADEHPHGGGIHAQADAFLLHIGQDLAFHPHVLDQALEENGAGIVLGRLQAIGDGGLFRPLGLALPFPAGGPFAPAFPFQLGFPLHAGLPFVPVAPLPAGPVGPLPPGPVPVGPGRLLEVIRHDHFFRLPLGEADLGRPGPDAQAALAFLLQDLDLHPVDGDLQLLQAVEDGFIDGTAS